MNASLDERVAIVTGGARGMGFAVAERLCAAGMRVVVADINSATVEKAAAAIGDSARPRPVDVTSEASVCELVDSVTGEMGRLDVLVNCAGVISIHPLAEITEEEWDRVLDVNLKGVYLCCRAAAPALLESPCGRIVNIASDVGKRGEADISHYAASKFGVVGFTQSLAMEFAPQGLTVNSVCPAITETDMMKQIVSEEAGRTGMAVADLQASAVSEIPLGRPTRPSDIAATVAFLVSEEAEFITGQAINVTGGRIMG